MREFRKTTGRNKKPQVWYVGVDPTDSETYMIKWGVLDGAMQIKTDRPGTCGVEGHSDFQTADKYALFCMNREIRKKIEQGYVEYVKGKPVREVATSVDFTKPLPKNLCFYKPKTEISNDQLKKLEDAGRAVWTLKRDGMMHLFVRANDNWTVYSRRMDEVTGKYPHIISTLEKLDVPNGTVLAGEIVVLNNDGSDNFKNVSRICRSKDDLALAYQGMGPFPKNKKGESVIGKSMYYVFDIPFYAEEDIVATRKVGDRLRLLREIFSKLDLNLSVNTGVAASKEQLMVESKRREGMLRQHYVAPVKIYSTSTGPDLELAKKLKAEGFVVMDIEAVYGDKGYSFDGKARRPSGIYKRKPKYEDEFIITDAYTGTGRNRERFGGFCIAQIHPKTGEEIDCGKCGGGFTDEHRDEFDESLIGETIKVEFDSRQPPKDGVYALRFPVFKGFADKKPEECIAQGIDEWI